MARKNIYTSKYIKVIVKSCVLVTMVLRNSTKTGVADQYTAGGPGGVSGYPRAWYRSLS